MAERHKQHDDHTTPPPVRHGPAKPVLLIVAALALFCILTFVVLNIDTGHERQSQVMPDDEIIELIAPRDLSDRDLLSSADRDTHTSIQPELSKGGVIEIADPQTQQLVQRYRFDSLDPNPEGASPGWLRMTRPRMEIFLDDDRVVTIDGDSVLAYRPHRAIESGTMTGNVVVRLYEGAPDRDVDFTIDDPTWVVTTDEASLDNFLGEIRCDSWVRIESDTMTLPGKRLRLLVDDQSNRIELRIAEPEYIRIVSDEGRALTRAPQQEPAPAKPAQRSNTSAQPRPSRGAESPASRVPQFYLLTIRDDVVIKQGDRDNRVLAEGDLLEAVFSTESRGLDSALAMSFPEFHLPTHAVEPVMAISDPMPLPVMVTQLAYASFDDTADEDEALLGPNVTLIRCTGPLTIVPLEESTRQLASSDDARLELTGSPTIIRDLASHSEARGRVMAYQVADELIELAGSDDHPLLVTSPELDAGGERFFHNQRANSGGFDGAGWMTRRAEPIDIAPDEPTGSTELHITWQRGMDLQFGDGSAGQRGGKLKSARFEGDVHVSTEEFTMDADEMTVGFSDDVDAGGEMDASSIEFIHAVGRVRVVGVADTSSIRCHDLHLDLMRSSTGDTIPKLMIAIGDVEAIDDDQMIWSDSLRVSFVEGDDDKPQVDELLAERDVQVLLADGTRAFADRLIGDGVRETIELLGEDVTIISDSMVMDRGQRLVLDRKAGTARSPGAGALRIYDRPVMEQQQQRIPRPTIGPDRTPDLSADWSESMLYDSTTNEGSGSVDFRGDVDVFAAPSPLERNTMTGESLTLVFQRVEGDTASDDEAARDTREAASSGRSVRTLIARQDAKIESQTFMQEDHEDDPTIFYIAGDYVEYDTFSDEALVAGAGELLIHDITPDAEGQALDATPFGAKGSTLMRWTRELRMTRRVDDIFDIVSRGDVSLQHRDLDGAISWITAQRLDATIRRHEEDQPQRGDGTLDMGGSAELHRVRGSGGVVVRTDRRIINCDSFDYDVLSGMARMSAEPGRVLSIETQGSANIVTAAEAVWDMRRDSISITRAAGTN